MSESQESHAAHRPDQLHDDSQYPPTVHAVDSIDASSISPNSVEGIFLLSLQKDNPAERKAFLHEICGDDEDRFRRVTALLRAFEDAGSFLETPVGGPRPQQEISLSFLRPVSKDGCLGMIGPYEVLDIIGRGGMGIVLRAVDPKLNRVVAVKVLLPELAVNPNARRRFLREAQAAAAVSHPHVVTIHAVEDAAAMIGEKNSTPPFLVMECVVGQSLQQKLDRIGSLRLTEILRISRQIGEGLGAAHKQGLIHRDIKPANILLENGVERVKITDFGLARAIDDITVTRTGEVSGTPQYMSPEQACGERVDQRSDLFSMGCLMYAMCTGHSPFRGDTIAHVIKRVTQDVPRPIAEQNPEVPAWFVLIIDCLLQKNPDHRFQTAEGLVVILDQHLAAIQHPTDSGSHSMINQSILPVMKNSPHDSSQGRATRGAEAKLGQAVDRPMPPWLLTPIPTPASWFFGTSRNAYRTGTYLLGTGALVVFGLVAWMLLVSAEVIDASLSIRNMAGAILGVSMSVAAVCIIAGMLLREEILGHATWKKLFRLMGYTLLGPIGIGLWIWKQSNPEPSTPPTSGDRTIPTPAAARSANVAGESAAPQTVSMQFGSAIVHEVPLENYLHYAAIRRLGMMWILLTISAAVFSILTTPQAMLSQLPFHKIVQRLGTHATMLLVGWALLMAIVSQRRQMSMRIWGLLTLSNVACILVGSFWATILRIPTADGGAMLRTITGLAIPPTLFALIYCGYVLRAMTHSAEFRQLSAASSSRTITLMWLIPFVIMCMLFSRWMNSHSDQAVLIPEEIKTATEFVAQRFRKPVSSVASVGSGKAVVVLKSDNGLDELIHLKKSPTGLWELDAAHHATTIEIGKGDTLGPKNTEWSGLIVTKLDAGLYVSLIGSGPRIIGFTSPLLPEGRHKIPVGSYLTLVFDTQAGWLGNVKSSPMGDYEKIFRSIDMTMSGLDIGKSFCDMESGTWTVSQYAADPSHIDMKAGEFTSISARRDLRKIADGSAYFNRDGRQRFVNGQFYRFLWNGETFSLSSDQAIVVDVLLKRLADGQVETPEQVVLDAVFEASGKRADSIQAVFNFGNHPAWANVVTSGSKDDATTISMVPLRLN